MLSVFSAALDKELVRRVSERIHSANIKTLGKIDVSDSELGPRWHVFGQFPLSQRGRGRRERNLAGAGSVPNGGLSS